MASERVDAVIVGAGLAGLTAARRLVKRGARCIVLEANPRVGGRTLSVRLGRGRFDLGAQWIGKGHDRIRNLVDELGIQTFVTRGVGEKLFVAVERDPRRYAGFLPPMGLPGLAATGLALLRIERLRRAVPLDEPRRAPGADRLDTISVAEWLRRAVPRDVTRNLLEGIVRAVMAVDPDEISMLHFLFYMHAGGGVLKLVSDEGAQHTRVMGGTAVISERMAAELGERVVVEAPVTRIRQLESSVVVGTRDGREFEARRAIVTCPPGLARRIQVDPPMPEAWLACTDLIPMRPSMKTVLAYEDEWWAKQGLAGDALSTHGLLTLTFHNTSHDGAQPSLACFIRGRHCDRLAGLPPDARKAAIVEDLVRLYGPEARRFTGYGEKVWDTTDAAQGCHNIFKPGAWSAIGRAIRHPIGRIHFAGAEYAGRWHGYMEGAVRTGAEAADEILSAP